MALRSINILFVILQMEMGGSEKLVYEIIKGLDLEVFKPSIAWFYGENEPLEEFKKLGIPCYQIPKKRRFDFDTMKKFADLIKDKNIDIVNAHHFMSFVYLFYGCKIKNKISLIYTEHSQWEIQKIGFKWRLLARYMMMKTDRIVCVNDKIEKDIKKKFGVFPKKVISIANGVPDIAKVDSQHMKEIRSELGIEDGIKIIAIVANFKKIKNHFYLLQAFDRLIKRYSNVKLLLIGQGFKHDKENTEEEIIKYIEEQKIKQYVKILGYRNDVHRILNVVDIFCLVSLKEGTPISLIEAMSAAIPVIGTNVEGIKDIIEDGINGYLVDINNIDDMANKMYALLNDEKLRDQLGKKAKELINKKYSFDDCINSYQMLFEKTLVKGI